MKRPLSLLSLGFALAALTAPACGSTEGRIVTIDVALESLGDPDFATSTGFEVHLDEALVAMGPMFAFAPRPGDDDPGLALARFLRPMALAHGGIDPLNGRRVRAEWLSQVAFDALAPAPLALGAIEAEAGRIDSVSLVLDSPSGANAGVMNGHHLFVRGVAERDGVVYPFAGGLDIPDAGISRRVEAIPIDAFIDEGGRWLVGVRVAAWFEDAHFDRLDVQDDEGVFQITVESQVRSAWLLGAKSQRAYEARYEESAE
jgi:hypothetical protein